MNQVLTFFGGSVIGVFIGYFIKYYLDLRYNKKIEEMNKKRKIYEDLIDSLNVFISNRSESEELKKKLLETYARLWLWASDDVIIEVGEFLQNQIDKDKNNNLTELELKKSFVNAVIAMRKDIGYHDTLVSESNYKFVSF